MTRILKAKLSPRPRGRSAWAPDPKPTAWLRGESAPASPGPESWGRTLTPGPCPAPVSWSTCLRVPDCPLPPSSWPHVSPPRGLTAPMPLGSVAWVTFLRWCRPRPAPSVIYVPLASDTHSHAATAFLPPASARPPPSRGSHLSAGTFATNKRSEGQGRTCLQLWGGLAARGPSLSTSAPSIPRPRFQVGAGPCAQG